MIRITDSSIQPFEIEHAKRVRKISPECTLLLKSNGLLPLKEMKKVALFGSGARKTIKGGTGSGDVNVRHFVTIEEGFKNAGVEIVSDKWLDEYDAVMVEARKGFVQGIKDEAKAMGVSPMMICMGRAMKEPEYKLGLDFDADTAVYVIARNSGEGADREIVAGDINLTETEIRDITYLNKNYKNFVLVLNVGGVLDLTPVDEVENILYLGQLGQETGNVLADLLLGKAYPSGKLTTTWAPIAEYPSTEGFANMDDTEYKEGVYVGYRYFDTVKKIPTYPFGFGLSYTDFEINTVDARISKNEISVDLAVKNIGGFAGKEVVQVYVTAPSGKLDKPYQELVAYAKTKELQPNESEKVTITFKAESMASYDMDSASYILEAGKYIIRVGNCSRKTAVAAVVNVESTITVSKHKNICNGLSFKDAVYERTVGDDLNGVKELTLAADAIATKEYCYSPEPTELTSEKTGLTWDDVKKNPDSLDDFVAGLSNEQLAYLSLGQFDEAGGMGTIIGSASDSMAGAAGETTAQLKNLGVPTLVMADGPAGIRVCTQYKLVDGKAKGLDNPLAGFEEFVDMDELKAMSAAVEPSQEEKEAPINYIYCTAIPIGTELAQSWSDAVCEECGDIVGEEMEMFGVHLWLAPALNIHRSPLCGRNFEYYSEDPVISGKTAAAITRGVQKHKGCATTIKHFACNNQETNRMRSNSILSERALREIYLKGFEIAVVESQPKALMTSYNLINGEHSCNSRDLITCALRDEWGYKGIVMTDWYVTTTIMSGPMQHKHPEASAAGCVYAGNDITMPAMVTDKADMLESVGNDAARYPIERAHLQATGKRVLGMILELA
ncbi:MAG: glycoside hydrolase family 3 C-terminal domain-containing protein [Pseudobutyrivibrio sp.]|nr:glycoside hydrolase family 3 C-terminal domain-containing protein [Pseudobutyrivibrio sp.]